MTKIQILSDVHQDFWRNKYDHVIEDGVDIVVVAGDLQEGSGIESLVTYIQAGKRVVYVAGNHEFYGHEIGRARATIKQHADLAGVDFLDNETMVINGIRFIGSTLWTDFKLYGEANEHVVRIMCHRQLNDFREIKIKKHFSGVENILLPLKPDDVVEMHKWAKTYIHSELSKPHDGPTIVVSHHAPSFMSVPDEFKMDYVSGAYASNLEELIMKYQPNIWIHGHTHTKFDYKIGDTRVICNPRGYTHERANFVPMVIDV